MYHTALGLFTINNKNTKFKQAIQGRKLIQAIKNSCVLCITVSHLVCFFMLLCTVLVSFTQSQFERTEPLPLTTSNQWNPLKSIHPKNKTQKAYVLKVDSSFDSLVSKTAKDHQSLKDLP